MEFEFSFSDSDGNYYSGTVRESSYDYAGTEKGSAIVVISAAVMYILGLIGMGIMLTSIPSHLLIMGICAFLLYLLPIPIVLIGGAPFKHIFGALARYAYLVFNLFVGMWWILYTSGQASEMLIIGLSIPMFYAVYYFPAILIYNGSKNESKLLSVIPIILCFVLGFVFMLIFNTFPFLNMVFATTFTVVGTLTISIMKLISDIANDDPKKLSISLFVIYLAIAIAVLAVSIGLTKAHKQEDYDRALSLIANGEYAEARSLLTEIIDFKDAKDQYNGIKYKGLKVGETITDGRSEYTNALGTVDTEEIEWSVLKVESGKALLISRKILDFIEGDPNDYLNSPQFKKMVPDTTSDYFLLTRSEYSEIAKDTKAYEVLTYLHYLEAAKNTMQKLDGNYIDGWRLASDDEKTYFAFIEDVFSKNTDKHYGIRPCVWIDTE